MEIKSVFPIALINAILQAMDYTTLLHLLFSGKSTNFDSLLQESWKKGK